MSNQKELSLPEIMRATPMGVFKLFLASDKEELLKQSMENMAQLADRVRHARDVGCYIEVISLRMQYLDRWLRILHSNSPQDKKRAREFGHLLKQCKQSGIDEKLYDQINVFNKHRIDAIHGFLVGTTKYQVLGQVVHDSDGIGEALAESVIKNAGQVITADILEQTPGNVGDQIIEVNDTIAFLRSRDPI